MAKLKVEIAQEAPFASVEEEAFLNLMRTSECLRHAFESRIRAWRITSTQYNVLRILRGAQPHGLTCSVIGSRMIALDPDITRLLARLKSRNLIRQECDRKDRRVVRTHISEDGLALLDEMRPVIDTAPAELLKGLSRAEVVELIRLLEAARGGNESKTPQIRDEKIRTRRQTLHADGKRGAAATADAAVLPPLAAE
jgi:DNA-binding MarR family transcriptional regulator